MGQQDKTVGFGLGDKHPVEWIGVDGGEVRHARGMEKGHGERTDAAIEAIGLHLGGGDRDGGRGPRVFQGDFPEGGGAEMEFVRAVGEEGARPGGQFFAADHGPDKDVGIKENLHGAVPSIRDATSASIASKAASKSSGRLISSFIAPILRPWPASETGVICTAGLPRR